MSIAELKLDAINKIYALSNKEDILEVVDFLKELDKKATKRILNLSQHFDKVNERYSETLKKLSQ